MSTITMAAERQIPAPPARIYRALADFQNEHHRFLPPAFGNFKVEQGGFGAGTVASFTITAGGRTRAYRTEVAEPEPGRVLTETDQLSGALTTFTVDPQGSGARVRIETTWQPASGIAGWLERLMAPRVVQRLYRDELERLERYVTTNPTS